MVFNVLWLTAIAVASMLSGFCMGRLTVRSGEEPEEQGDRRVHWEMEAAGNAAVRMEEKEWETGGEGRWIRRADHAGREAVAEKTSGSVDTVVRKLSGNAGSLAGGPAVFTGQRQRRDTAKEAAREGLSVGMAGRLMSAGARAVRADSRQMRPGKRFHRRRTPQEPAGKTWTVGSPVNGYVTSYQEEEHPTVLLCPGEDRLYAPEAGKIIRLYPMGNAFLFRTESGTDLYIRAGEAMDDLLGRYFRPRVVQNEIVSKGKLLLEFDRQGLGEEGVSAMILVRVENRAYGSRVALVAEEKIKAGEELLQLTERPGPGSGRVE